MTQDGGSPGAAPGAGRSRTGGRTTPIVESARVLLDRVGTAALMAWTIARELRRPRAWVDAALQQAWVMGIRSLPLVLIISVLGGAVTSQQAGAQFTGGLPLWVIGSISAASILTELGPMLTGMVLVGRIGASIAAELASMKVTEQIDALRAMGRDPWAYLVVPRVVAGILVVPPLVVLANAAALVSAWAVALVAVPGMTSATFIYGVRFYFYPFALVFSMLKGIAFGMAITFLACMIGLEGDGGAEGVGRTTTAAVVATTLALLVLDVMFAPLLRYF
jgi:phospholipid/cholesterol/gamma-HCH transport system permease protein